MAAAAAATATPDAGTGSSASPTSRFAAACGALGQYIKAAELARPAVPVRPLPLMPGTDVDATYDVPDDQEQRRAGPAPAQLTIVYGGRVLVLEDVPADKAAALLRLAATAARDGCGTAQTQGSGAVCSGQLPSAADLPVARKASLQRFMEKRRGRAAAPYRRPDCSDACPDDHLKLAL